MATANSPPPSAFLLAIACNSSTHLPKMDQFLKCNRAICSYHARRNAVGLFQASTTRRSLPMRAMLCLKVLIQKLDGWLEPNCGVTRTSIHSLALPASSRPWKNSNTASSVSANALDHVWLMNQFASPTQSFKPDCASSSPVTLPRFREVLGRTNIWQNWEHVRRAPDVPIMARSVRM